MGTNWSWESGWPMSSQQRGPFGISFNKLLNFIPCEQRLWFFGRGWKFPKIGVHYWMMGVLYLQLAVWSSHINGNKVPNYSIGAGGRGLAENCAKDHISNMAGGICT